jgi:hypothetical protein
MAIERENPKQLRDISPNLYSAPASPSVLRKLINTFPKIRFELVGNKTKDTLRRDYEYLIGKAAEG